MQEYIFMFSIAL